MVKVDDNRKEDTEQKDTGSHGCDGCQREHLVSPDVFDTLFDAVASVLNLMVLALLLIADYHAFSHGNNAFFCGVDDLTVVGYHKNGRSSVVDFLQEP